MITESNMQKVEYEAVSGLPLLQAKRQPCHHPQMESTEFEFYSKVDENKDFTPPPREGHSGKLCDPNISKNDWKKKYYFEKDDTYVWYGKPHVTFRINNHTSILRANSF